MPDKVLPEARYTYRPEAEAPQSNTPRTTSSAADGADSHTKGTADLISAA